MNYSQTTNKTKEIPKNKINGAKSLRKNKNKNNKIVCLGGDTNKNLSNIE